MKLGTGALLLPFPNVVLNGAPIALPDTKTGGVRRVRSN
jgi:hypothetical protein